MPKSTTTELEAAQAALDRARSDADAAEERAKVAKAAAEGRRQAALEAYDRRVLDDYDDADLEARIDAARQRVLDAAEADPVYQSLVDLAETISVAYAESVEANRIVSTLGIDRQIGQHSPAADINVEAVMRHMALRASARAADASDAADVKRNAVGDAAAKS